MPIGRSLSVLNLYDVLANLVPGVSVLLAGLLLFAYTSTTEVSGGALLLIVVVFGLILGHMLQWGGSWLDGWLNDREEDNPNLFMEVLEDIDSENDESELGSVTHVEEQFWPLCRERFDLPADFSQDNQLLLLVLSYLETRPATRALRFQAIHSFHRSMTIASIVVTVFSVAALLLRFRVIVTPWSVIIVIGIGAAAGIYVFNDRRNKFEKTFLRYVFLDFYQDHVTGVDAPDSS